MTLVGIDEVGRGCLAGPLVCAAVMLNGPINGLKDSKLLSKSQREKLDIIIRNEALAIGIGWTTPQELDEAGLTKGTTIAMVRALNQIDVDYDEVIIDGNYNYLSGNTKCRTVIKADASVPAVSAASIIAKVARDTYMTFLAKDYPDYGFESHVGYGTARHRSMLRLIGATEIHRRSFKPVSEVLISTRAAA